MKNLRDILVSNEIYDFLGEKIFLDKYQTT
jgi:hypothetical protein